MSNNKKTTKDSSVNKDEVKKSTSKTNNKKVTKSSTSSKKTTAKKTTTKSKNTNTKVIGKEVKKTTKKSNEDKVKEIETLKDDNLNLSTDDFNKEMVDSLLKKIDKKNVVEPSSKDKDDVKPSKDETVNSLFDDKSAIIKEIVNDDKSSKVNDYVNDIFEKDNKKHFKESTFHKNAEIKEDEIIKEKTKINKSIIIIITLLIIIVLLFLKTLNNNCPSMEKNNSANQNTVIIEKEVEENILFVGDSLTENYDIDKYYPTNITVSNTGNLTTEELLKEIKNNIYIYNPSKTILMVGNDDINSLVDKTDLINNMKQIINEIKLNRSSSEIIVVSLFPANEDNDIKYINEELNTFCNDKEISFVDVYEDFKDTTTLDNNTLTNKGYELLTSKLVPYINEK